MNVYTYVIFPLILGLFSKHKFLYVLHWEIVINFCCLNGYRICGYNDGKICRQLRLLIWTSFIGQFVHPVGGNGMYGGLDGRYSSWEYHFIRLHINLVQHPSNNISIVASACKN